MKRSFGCTGLVELVSEHGLAPLDLTVDHRGVGITELGRVARRPGVGLELDADREEEALPPVPASGYVQH